MKSPFPGMDPYLESRWSDVHSALIIAIREALQPRLPSNLRARSEERVLLEAGGDEDDATYRADVAVVETRKTRPTVSWPTLARNAAASCLRTVSVPVVAKAGYLFIASTRPA